MGKWSELCTIENVYYKIYFLDSSAILLKTSIRIIGWGFIASNQKERKAKVIINPECKMQVIFFIKREVTYWMIA